MFDSIGLQRGQEMTIFSNESEAVIHEDAGDQLYFWTPE